jgi:hypothetical protein
MARSVLYPFNCSPVSGGSLAFQELQNMNLVLNSQKAEQIPSGTLDVACTYLANAAPMARFTTHDLFTFFTACGPASVVPFTAGTARAVERTVEGAFETTGDTYAIAKGTIVPQSLSASQNSNEGAALQFAVFILSDGTNEPIVRATGASFSSAPSPACVSKYFMGPSYIDFVQIPNIEETSIEFGVNYDAKGFNGSPYPTEGAIVGRRPSISFKTTALNFDAARNMFLSALGGALNVYFPRGVDGDDRVSGATAQHLKISAAAGSICSEDVTAQENEDGTLSLKVTPHGALSVNVASTLP